MINITELLMNRKIKGFYHGYIDRSLRVFFEDGLVIIFFNCALVFDLGMTGHSISFVSESSVTSI